MVPIGESLVENQPIAVLILTVICVSQRRDSSITIGWAWLERSFVQNMKVCDKYTVGSGKIKPL